MPLRELPQTGHEDCLGLTFLVTTDTSLVTVSLGYVAMLVPHCVPGS